MQRFRARADLPALAELKRLRYFRASDAASWCPESEQSTVLRQQPGQRDLGGGHLFLSCKFCEHIHKGLIRFAILLAETRDCVAKIGAVELRVRADFSREKAFAQGTEGNKSDAEFFQGRQHFHFRLTPPQRIFALERAHRLDGVGAADGLHAGFGQAKVFDFSLLNQFLHGTSDVFNGHVRVNAVLVEQINSVNAQPLERTFHDLLDVLRPTVQSG